MMILFILRKVAVSKKNDIKFTSAFSFPCIAYVDNGPIDPMLISVRNTKTTCFVDMLNFGFS